MDVVDVGASDTGASVTGASVVGESSSLPQDVSNPAVSPTAMMVVARCRFMCDLRCLRM
jgi:hypothetical protein